jgi:hypothetical protein
MGYTDWPDTGIEIQDRNSSILFTSKAKDIWTTIVSEIHPIVPYSARMVSFKEPRSVCSRKDP